MDRPGHQDAADAELDEARHHLDGACYLTPTGPIGFIERTYRGASGRGRARVVMTDSGNVHHVDFTDLYIAVTGS